MTINKAERLRSLADALTATIEAKRNPRVSQQNSTRRRQNMAAKMAAEADHLERLQILLRGLADGHENGTLSVLLRKIGDRATIETMIDWNRWPREGDGYPHFEETKAKVRKRLERAGLGWASYDDARAALLALESAEVKARQAAIREARAAEDEVINLIGVIPGFFPTPAAVADRMVALAEIDAGMTVLEPSAGSGALAARIRHHHPQVRLCCVEAVYSLQNILEAKGFDLVGLDFLDDDFLHAEGVPDRFDRVVMNPPFEDGQDIQHVRRAFSLLAPGGRLVAVMAAGAFFRSDKQAVEFREWLDSVSWHEIIDLPDGSFRESKTGVSAKLLVLDNNDREDTEPITGFTREERARMDAIVETEYTYLANKHGIGYTPHAPNDSPYNADGSSRGAAGDY